MRGRALGLCLLLLPAGCAVAEQGPAAHASKLVHVREVGADSLAAELTKQLGLRGGDDVSLVVDPATNTIAVGWGSESAALASTALRRIADLDDSRRRAWTPDGTGTTCGRLLEGETIPLQHANAVELARTLSDWLDVMDQSEKRKFLHGAMLSSRLVSLSEAELSREFEKTCPPSFSIRADPATNSVIVSADDGEGLPQLREFIARLDVERPKPR